MIRGNRIEQVCTREAPIGLMKKASTNNKRLHTLSPNSEFKLPTSMMRILTNNVQVQINFDGKFYLKLQSFTTIKKNALQEAWAKYFLWKAYLVIF